MPQIEKVYAYITRNDQLLVFRHVDFPEAGVQVPGGTLDEGETPEAAVLREAGEETGLSGLVINNYLGKDEHQEGQATSSKSLVRYFFHLISHQTTPDTWQHDEHHPSDGSPGPILFEFYWLPVTEAAEELDPYFAAMLDRLPLLPCKY